MSQRLGETIALAILPFVLRAVGIAEHHLDHILLSGELQVEERQPASHAHRHSRLAAIAGQARQYQMVTLALVVDARHVVVGFLQTELVDEPHGVAVVIARQQPLLRISLDGERLHRPGQGRRIGIEGLRLRVVVQVGVAAQIAVAVECRLQFLDRQAELHVVSHAGLLIEVRMEAPHLVVALRQTAVEERSATDNLHRAAARADKGEHRLGYQARPRPHRLSLLDGGQIVHLEQHQTVVTAHQPLLVPVLPRGCEAHSRQVLRVIRQEAVVGIILHADLCQRIDGPQLAADLPKSLILDRRHHLFRV